MKDFMCYNITGEGALVAGEDNAESPICFTAEMMCLGHFHDGFDVYLFCRKGTPFPVYT